MKFKIKRKRYDFHLLYKKRWYKRWQEMHSACTYEECYNYYLNVKDKELI